MSLQVIQMTEQRLIEIVESATRMGAYEALRLTGAPVKEYFTRSELKRRHGAGIVNDLIKQGKLTPHKYGDGEHKRIVYSERELLSHII